MAFRFILLVLPALTVASIEVEISGKYNGDANDLKVQHKGDDTSIISETETTTFNVNNTRLKNSVPAYYREQPHIVASRTRTAWGDLRKTYSWNQVTRTLIPISGKIYENSVAPTIVAYQIFENNSTIPKAFNVGLSRSVVNKVLSTWRTSGELSEIKINYSIKINRANVSRERSFSYTSSWGQHISHSQIVTVGTSSNINMIIQPGEGVVARLEATKEFVKVEMKYDASLSGKVAVHYADLFKGYFYYLVPINYCMRRAGISNQKTSWEFIDIEFFSDSKVVVSDLRHGHVLLEVH